MTIKRKIFLLSIISTGMLAWTLTFGKGIFDPLWLSIFLAIWCYVGLYWVVGFNVNTFGFVTALLPPAMALFFVSYVAQTGFSDLNTVSEAYIAGSLVVYFSMSYIFMVTANVINTWTFKRVALAQVAVTVFLFLTLLTFYLGIYMLIGFGSLPVLLLGSVLVGGFLAFCNIWLSGVGIADSLKLSVLLAISLLFSAFVLFFWPVPVEVYSAALSSIFFVFTGITIHAKKKTLGFWVWIEYLIVFFLAIVFLFLTARWGIAGVVW